MTRLKKALISIFACMLCMSVAVFMPRLRAVLADEPVPVSPLAVLEDCRTIDGIREVFLLGGSGDSVVFVAGIEALIVQARELEPDEETDLVIADAERSLGYFKFLLKHYALFFGGAPSFMDIAAAQAGFLEFGEQEREDFLEEIGEEIDAAYYDALEPARILLEYTTVEAIIENAKESNPIDLDGLYEAVRMLNEEHQRAYGIEFSRWAEVNSYAEAAAAYEYYCGMDEKYRNTIDTLEKGNTADPLDIIDFLSNFDYQYESALLNILSMFYEALVVSTEEACAGLVPYASLVLIVQNAASLPEIRELTANAALLLESYAEYIDPLFRGLIGAATFSKVTAALNAYEFYIDYDSVLSMNTDEVRPEDYAEIYNAYVQIVEDNALYGMLADFHTHLFELTAAAVAAKYHSEFFGVCGFSFESPATEIPADIAEAYAEFIRLRTLPAFNLMRSQLYEFLNPHGAKVLAVEYFSKHYYGGSVLSKTKTELADTDVEKVYSALSGYKTLLDGYSTMRTELTEVLSSIKGKLDAFKFVCDKKYAPVYGENPSTLLSLKIADASQTTLEKISAALADYAALTENARANLVSEYGYLRALEFAVSNARVLSLNERRAKQADRADIDAALTEYAGLPEAAKNALSAQYAQLTRLDRLFKDRIVTAPEITTLLIMLAGACGLTYYLVWCYLKKRGVKHN